MSWFIYFRSVLSAVNPAIAALKRPKALPREIGLRPIQLCASLEPRLGLRQRSAYRGKAAIFTLPESPMTYRGFPSTQRGCSRVFSPITESPKAAFELFPSNLRAPCLSAAAL
jgi:hypothetical protein